MNAQIADVKMGLMAYALPSVNLGYELFLPCNQALVRIARSFVGRNEPAHDWSHVCAVGAQGVEVAKRLGVDAKPFLLAALCHDMFSDADRAEHHLRAGEWVREHLGTYEDKALVEVVARMCEQHRASYKGEYTGIFEEGFATADRGPVGLAHDCKAYWRSFQYTRAKNPEYTILRTCEAVAAHMIEKFGAGGYAKWPDLYVKLFKEELTDYQARIAARPTAASVLDLLCTEGYLEKVMRIPSLSEFVSREAGANCAPL